MRKREGGVCRAPSTCRSLDWSGWAVVAVEKSRRVEREGDRDSRTPATEEDLVPSSGLRWWGRIADEFVTRKGGGTRWERKSEG